MSELDYPLDHKKILRKRSQIVRSLRASNNGLIKKNIAVLGGSTTSILCSFLELFLLDIGIDPEFYESDYNRYFEEAVFPNERLDAFGPDFILVHVTHYNITRFPDLSMAEREVDKLLISEMEKFDQIWEGLSKYGCPIIQNNFDTPIFRVLGNLDGYDYRGKTHCVNELNEFIGKRAQANKDLYINDINYLAAYVGLPRWIDHSLWHSARSAVSMESTLEIAFNVSKIVRAIMGVAKKALMLDLDNTCWGGVVGENGIDGIKIGDTTALGSAFSEFQKYIKELQQRGVILAVNSKNNEEIAREGFEHEYSILSCDDFSAFIANWDAKDVNALLISKKLNISLDSFVFIDDNPAERELVSKQFPEIKVPSVSPEPMSYLTYVDRSGFFEPVSISLEDSDRTQYYSANAKRDKSSMAYKSYDEFLKSLEMKAELRELAEGSVARVSQLLNKTNQFNLTTKRYSLSEVDRFRTDPTVVAFTGRLIDKFGDNGVVSVIVAKIRNEVCEIDSFVMSCRVFKRGLEYAMLDHLVFICRELGLSKILGDYVETPKNRMVSDFYSQFGFESMWKSDGNKKWVVDVPNYISKVHAIELSHG